ncbi:max-like protein X isoform X4 [Canis lupus baileyi]|uniref:max-like protein X isoform X4 n=1 Tax=Canis lupus dingo TaxID=286419 RepID=UPI0003AE564A|nr:max-like protein X isoform X4 [Canis lupus dingo]
MCLTLRQEGRRPRGSAGTDSVSAPAPASPARCPSLWVAHARPSPRPPPLVPGWWVRVTWVRLASSSRQGARPRAGFRFGGSEMTEPGASPDDPWVKVEYAYSDNSLDPDDEDSDYHQESYKESYKDRRRRAHTQAEQKRRDAIKRGYDDLQTIVPTCQQQDFSIGSQKLSKAIVLQKTIDYIQFLHKEKKKQEEEVSMLRKDVTALKIMKVNYEQIVKAHQDNPHEGEDQVSDQVKFNVFQGIMDSLFQSFNASISVASFQELSACVFSWIEEHCKPQTLREIVIGVLHQLKNQLY